MIDTLSNARRRDYCRRGAAGPARQAAAFRGAAPNALALSPNGGTLYVDATAENALAFVPLAGPAPHHVAGAYADRLVSQFGEHTDGDMLYVVNGRSDAAA